ncbi:Phytanoyl-CoA dioxygenase (PhyH) [Seminavis robusta]|uniref:Phytanoyl-CoA dioxygenase (PhyH) n=1 Tax=Seminavis robusta TaxID=568900 RepID=A0A9N8H9S6_9STRA|nr:Phytanoyl-CoA dioxygenase (PhyH) [Seminavis robusta]|eukprot:Sro266_g103200.1 Phytanoyl-CoA dioxygenase (PhyH) (873) ;mRNA; r:47676-50373
MLLDTSTSAIPRTAHGGPPVESNNKAMMSASKKKKSTSQWTLIIRAIILEGPVVLLFAALLSVALVQRVYGTYVVPIVESYRRSEMVGDFYPDYANDFTYYNRHCGPKDLSTRSSNDLLIQEHYTGTEAADVMLEHGAVAFQNALSNDTATELRAYLALKHHNKQNLSYNEVFWEEQNRLSLGIGTNDHPAIAKAMKEIGNHPVIKRTLEGILGPDPAIVEISTLTSLNGAHDQGIHTDSDWFGSSLLYSRTFLHSYSMFVALQDTSKDLGATTVCPGSHFCADKDLEELCLEHGAFEVSTNGHTGEHGLLRKGDAFLFNQNIWHRGPKNVDPDGLDRIMFIMTFATAKDDSSDHRIQGLGTYYYQRFNMWGATFSMLKDATKTMVQPLAGLRALGFIPTRGVTWIQQFAHQFANGEEFYADYELEDFVEKILNANNVPMFLRSTSDRWAKFIPEMLSIGVEYLAALNGCALFFYAVGLALCAAVSPTPVGVRRSVTRLGLIVMLTAGTIGAISWYFDQTELAQSVISEAVFAEPFPEPPTEPSNPKSITFPERNDVLISTRFDAKFLASFNRFLSFHPGNRVWEKYVADAALLPASLLDLAAQKIVRDIGQIYEVGLASRFLRQDHQTGAWLIMSQKEAVEESVQAIVRTKHPLIGHLTQELKYMLADARFGNHRGTAMATMSEELLAREWLSTLYGKQRSSSDTTTQATKNNKYQQFQIDHANLHIRKGRQLLQFRRRTQRSPTEYLKLRVVEQRSRHHDDMIAVGDKVWVYGDTWYEGKLMDVLDDSDGICVVYVYNSGSYEEVHADDIRSYNVFKIGDRVDVDYHGTSEEFYPGVITNIHPDGTCSVRFDDGEHTAIGREYLLHFEES